MPKPRASYYCRYGDLIVSASAETFGPDGIDELRVQVMRGFSEGMNYVDVVEPDTEAPTDPGTVDTTTLPPVE